MNVFILGPESDLTDEQKKKALSTVIFIKQKCDSRLKGKVCANGRK